MGELSISPTHLRDLMPAPAAPFDGPTADRPRRIRVAFTAAVAVQGIPGRGTGRRTNDTDAA